MPKAEERIQRIFFIGVVSGIVATIVILSLIVVITIYW
jgi:hypothetical protein